MPILKLVLVATAMAGLSACRAPTTTKETESIGVATMKEDGSIVLQLRAESADGQTKGDVYFVVLPSDENYQATLDRLGEIKPGESKPVPSAR